MTKKILIAILLLSTFGKTVSSQNKEVLSPKPYGAIPSEAQLKWHELELYSMLNFSTITYYGKEWGFGDEKAETFNPTEFDAEQIVRIAKQAGIKGIVIDAKHHGGFCLWPSKYNKHYTVKNSPWRKGKGDMVKEIADACRKHGLKVGIYLSPWDRNHKDYGTDIYLEYYKNQLIEILTNYGELFEIWLDGANGGDGYYGGANEMRKVDQKSYYPTQEWFSIIRELQPNAIIFSDCGPDVRWNGNEHGVSDENCRATISQTSWAEANTGLLNTGLKGGERWMPAEADFPLHLHPKGWFWHPHSPNPEATVEELVDKYFTSIGRNSAMDIGIAPDRRGLMCDNDSISLVGFGKHIEAIFKENLAKGAAFKASQTRGDSETYSASNVLNGKNEGKYWATNDTTLTADIIVDFGKPTAFSVVSLREYIAFGQRVDKWVLEAWQAGKWYEIESGDGIGARRLWRGPAIQTNKIRLRIINAAACPAISEIGVYLEPER